MSNTSDAQVTPVASVYAKSMFELATEHGGNDIVLEIADELEQLVELIATEKALGLFFSSPVIDEASRDASLKTMFSSRVSDLTLRFLLVLNSKGRLNSFESIAKAYDQLVQEAFGKIEVDVFTPTAIDAASIQTIKDSISAKLGKEPVIHPYIDEAMIGGLKLRIGDHLIDGSVQTKLRRISDKIQTGGSKAIRERIESYMEETN